MLQPIDLDLERFKRLPVIDDVWQLAIERLPQWVVEQDKPPFRPRVALCHAAACDRLGMSDLLAADAPAGRAAFDAIISLAKVKDVQSRPTRIELRDPALIDDLRPALEGTGIELATVERLAAIDEVLAEMTQRFAGATGPASLFAGPGVTVERVRAFAGAAVAFHHAAPWNHLTDEDLVRIDTPVPDDCLRWFTVLGGAGIERGLGFYRTEQDLHQLLDEATATRFLARARLWLFSFERVFELPVVDSELWETHGLPLAHAEAYPSLMCAEPTGRGAPADAARLTFVEGLLRALAATTEDELDGGRWSKTVATFDGERVVELSIPALLEPEAPLAAPGPGEPHPLHDRRLMEGMMADVHRAIAERGMTDIDEINAFLAAQRGKVAPREPDTSPAGRAQARFYQALEASGRRRIKLAREALAIHADCADARVLLAEEMPDLTRRTELYRQAMAAAERTLGSEPFEREAGHFWGRLETRPYMRARLGLAECL